VRRICLPSRYATHDGILEADPGINVLHLSLVATQTRRVYISLGLIYHFKVIISQNRFRENGPTIVG
jgi:hypothetical protein